MIRGPFGPLFLWPPKPLFRYAKKAETFCYQRFTVGHTHSHILGASDYPVSPLYFHPKVFVPTTYAGESN